MTSLFQTIIEIEKELEEKTRRNNKRFSNKKGLMFSEKIRDLLGQKDFDKWVFELEEEVKLMKLQAKLSYINAFLEEIDKLKKEGEVQDDAGNWIIKDVVELEALKNSVQGLSKGEGK